MQNKLLTANQVIALLGIARCTLWRWVRDERFPAPLNLGPRRIAWREAEVNAWIDALSVRGEA
ncbi:AlpA family phage regulatory protein [Pseudomonas psychrotolerans]|uniref:helix-turn-helix transcriptional regulator n=1 Tax=Pseudomonas TaxID=286 RepID=UPI0009B67A7B|nr:AlpA family phage regulatory protein [Pseudomonas psychrotolerans]MBA1212803.1 AlpA family phage regulatory protein [Pseudomonas psychrotolerans]